MRRDHRPNWLRRMQQARERRYLRRKVLPQCDAAGPGMDVTLPWNLHLFGAGITFGAHVHVRTTAADPVRLTTWPGAQGQGRISIGDYTLLCPGVRLQASHAIEIGSGTMLASHVLITDSDWHGLYDRTDAPGASAPVILEEDCWIGDSAILTKGVRVGRGSVIGAGSVVTRDVPAMSIAAGNPAQVVRSLDPARAIRGRASLFSDPAALTAEVEGAADYLSRGNTFLGWLRTVRWPRRGD